MSKDARREQLLEAALAAFLRGGYHATHVEDIVKEAGVARGTFYLHFDSKHAVFSVLVDRMLQVFLDVRPEFPEPDVMKSKDAAAILAHSYRTILEAFWQHRRLLRLLLEEAVGLEKGFAKKLEAHYREWHERVHHTIAYLQDRGVARKDIDVHFVAELVIGIVERITRTYLFARKKPDLDALVDQLVAFEMRGIGGG